MSLSRYFIFTIQHLPLGNVMFTGLVDKDGRGQEQSEMINFKVQYQRSIYKFTLSVLSPLRNRSSVSFRI